MAYYKEQYNEKNDVWYPQAVTVGKPIETKKIAQRLAQISTVSYADVVAVLAEMPGVMADYMSQGKSVRLDGLGTFRYVLDTDGVATREEMDFQKQLKAVRVRFIPQREGAVTKGGTATRSLVPSGIEWLKYDGQAASEGSGTAPAPKSPAANRGRAMMAPSAKTHKTNEAMKKRQTLEILAIAHTEALLAVLSAPDADNPGFTGKKKKEKKRRKRREEAD